LEEIQGPSHRLIENDIESFIQGEIDKDLQSGFNNSSFNL